MFILCNNEIRVLLFSGNMFIVTNTVHKYTKYVKSDVLISPSIAQPPLGHLQFENCTVYILECSP